MLGTFKNATKDKQGRHFVTLLGSNTLRDKHDERFTERALKDTAAVAKSGKLDLVDNHRAGFSFGKSVDGWTEQHDNGRDVNLLTKFELDMKYPQAQDLFKEAEDGECARECSPGGRLRKEKGAFFKAADPDTGDQIRFLHLFDGDHMAICRPTWAANGLTGAVAAEVIKDDGTSGEIDWDSAEEIDISTTDKSEQQILREAFGEIIEKRIEKAGGAVALGREGEKLPAQGKGKSNMPYYIKAVGGKFDVISKKAGKAVSSGHASRAEAEKKMQALMKVAKDAGDDSPVSKDEVGFTSFTLAIECEAVVKEAAPDVFKSSERKDFGEIMDEQEMDILFAAAVGTLSYVGYNIKYSGEESEDRTAMYRDAATEFTAWIMKKSAAAGDDTKEKDMGDKEKEPSIVEKAVALAKSIFVDDPTPADKDIKILKDGGTALTALASVMESDPTVLKEGKKFSKGTAEALDNARDLLLKLRPVEAAQEGDSTGEEKDEQATKVEKAMCSECKKAMPAGKTGMCADCAAKEKDATTEPPAWAKDILKSVDTLKTDFNTALGAQQTVLEAVVKDVQGLKAPPAPAKKSATPEAPPPATRRAPDEVAKESGSEADTIEKEFGNLFTRDVPVVHGRK